MNAGIAIIAVGCGTPIQWKGKNMTKDVKKRQKEESSPDIGYLDNEYPAHSKIANSGAIPFREGYPVIRRPVYAIAHEGPDDSEYCASPDWPDIYDDDYDCLREWYMSEEYYGFHPRLKYPDGYDG